MQAKHIPDAIMLIIVEKLLQTPRPTVRRGGESLDWEVPPTLRTEHICHVLHQIPRKVVLAKMRKLIERELLDGCVCGCYGGINITGKGYQYLSELMY